MTFLQWVFVIGVGIAGYAGVSWLIERQRAAEERRNRSAGETEVKPPVPTTGEQSAWDEFKGR